MHILFIGYGKTSQRIAQFLFEQNSNQQRHQITTISRSPKTDVYANHLIQDVHDLNLTILHQLIWSMWLWRLQKVV
jgi:pyrroline-5-carboxylate reductase